MSSRSFAFGVLLVLTTVCSPGQLFAQATPPGEAWLERSRAEWLKSEHAEELGVKRASDLELPQFVEVAGIVWSPTPGFRPKGTKLTLRDADGAHTHTLGVDGRFYTVLRRGAQVTIAWSSESVQGFEVGRVMVPRVGGGGQFLDITLGVLPDGRRVGSAAFRPLLRTRSGDIELTPVQASSSAPARVDLMDVNTLRARFGASAPQRTPEVARKPVERAPVARSSEPPMNAIDARYFDTSGIDPLSVDTAVSRIFRAIANAQTDEGQLRAHEMLRDFYRARGDSVRAEGEERRAAFWRRAAPVARQDSTSGQ